MIGALARNAISLTRRNVPTVFGRNVHTGYVGENLPFDITNPYKFTFLFTLFIGSGLALPFLVVRHQLLKP